MSAIRKYDDDTFLWIARCIVTRGLAVMSIGYGGCSVPGCRCGPEPTPWSYTIGRVEQGQPELITFIRCCPQCAGTALNWVHDRAAAGEPIEPDVPVDYGPNTSIKLVPVPREWMLGPGSDCFGRWIAHYSTGRDVLEPPEVWQVVFSDKDRTFPDEPGCDPNVGARQPILRDQPDWRPPPEPRPNRAERRRR